MSHERLHFGLNPKNGHIRAVKGTIMLIIVALYWCKEGAISMGFHALKAKEVGEEPNFLVFQ